MPCRPCDRAKPATVALPRTENSQNSGCGRSPPRSTPKIAVDSGSRPMKTIECAEVTCWSASAVSNGKPTTTPSATMTSETRSLRCRPRLAQQAEHGRTEQRRDGGARRRQEQRGEAADRHARRRQRAAEDHHADEAVAPAAARRSHVRLILLAARPSACRDGETSRQSSTILAKLYGYGRQYTLDIEARTKGRGGTRTVDVMSAIRASGSPAARSVPGDRLPSIRALPRRWASRRPPWSKPMTGWPPKA